MNGHANQKAEEGDNGNAISVLKDDNLEFVISLDSPSSDFYKGEEAHEGAVEDLEKQIIRREADQRMRLREPVALFFGTLLVFQHAFAYVIILEALKRGVLGELQLIFSALVAGTIAESYFIAKMIVEWIFPSKEVK